MTCTKAPGNGQHPTAIAGVSIYVGGAAPVSRSRDSLAMLEWRAPGYQLASRCTSLVPQTLLRTLLSLPRTKFQATMNMPVCALAGHAMARCVVAEIKIVPAPYKDL